MAGRPKTMAKKLAVIEERAYQLSVEVDKLCPRQYHERCSDWNELDYGAAWYRALAAAKAAADALNYVLGVLEERVFGIGEADDRDMLRQVRRGQWPAGLEIPETVKARLRVESPTSDDGGPRACAREGVAASETGAPWTR